MVDHKDGDRPLLRDEFQAQLLLERLLERNRAGRIRYAPRRRAACPARTLPDCGSAEIQREIEGTGEPGLVERGLAVKVPACDPRKFDRELRHCYVLANDQAV